MLPRRIPLALAVASFLALALAAPAGAFDLSNCTLELTSFDADGNQLDTASGPGAGGTQDDPFVVTWDGTVHYVATSGDLVLMDNSWHVDVFGIPTPLRGSDPNTAGTTMWEDTISVKDNMPIEVAGLFYVSGEMTSPDGSCAGSAWLKMDADPLTTIPFWASVGITLVGLVLLWFSQPSVKTA